MSADPPKKPKDIKDLKARLGRTIVPTTQKGGVPAPSLGGDAPGEGIAPPSFVAPVDAAAPPSVTPPPAFATAPGLASVAPPPFMQPAAAPAAPAAPAAAPRPADPFAAVPSYSEGPREVRLVIDEKPVDDSEIGRKQRGRTFIVLALGVLLGGALGFGTGNVVEQNRLRGQVIADGKEIYNSVHSASDVVNQSKRLVGAALEKASANPPSVDFASIEQLRALKKPFEAGVFARRKYGAFQPGTVDALFEYYNNVNLLWDKIASLSARTLNQGARTELTNAAQAAGELATTAYGLVPRSIEGALVGTLVFVDPPPAPPAGEQPQPRTEASVRATRGGAAATKKIYTGQSLEEDPSQYVILVEGASSVNVLGQQANAFGQYRANLAELKTLLDKTIEIQGRLETELGQIAALSN
jgi:hypothetical protein